MAPTNNNTRKFRAAEAGAKFSFTTIINFRNRNSKKLCRVWEYNDLDIPAKYCPLSLGACLVASTVLLTRHNVAMRRINLRGGCASTKPAGALLKSLALFLTA